MNPDETTAPSVDALIDAIQQQHWTIAVGLGIALAIYVANRANLLKHIPSKYTPTIAVALGILSSVGAQLSTGVSWEEAIGKGFLAGAAATGLWEMLLKHFLKFPKKTVAEEKAPEEEAPEEEAPEEGPSEKEEPASTPPKSKSKAPVEKKQSTRKAKAADKPVEASTAAPKVEETSEDSTSAPPKRRGRPRKNPEA
jgi:high mobility group AT-hook protein 2